MTDSADEVCIMPIPVSAPPPPMEHPRLGRATDRWTYTDASSATVGYVARFDHDGSKEILPLTLWRASDGRLQWRWRQWPSPRPLLNGHGLAADPTRPVLVVEGEKAARKAHALFPEYAVTTSPGGCKAADKADWSAVARRDVVIWPDADEPGADYAQQVADLATQAGANMVRIVDVHDLPAKWDLADAPPHGLDVRARIEQAAPQMTTHHAPVDAIAQEIDRMAGLKPHQYEAERRQAAKALGFRVPVLDAMVQEARERVADRTGIIFPEVSPHPSPVDGAQLLDDILAALRMYIVAEDETHIATALWIVMSWFIDDIQVAPLAVITAPEKRCGKSQLLDLIGRLSRRPLVTSNITSAALFRVIEAHGPTLLIDEADTFMKENEGVRGVLNSGHTRSCAFVIRSVGDDHTPQQFSTWGAKAISGIGHLPETLMDRAVVLRLRRKLDHEKVQRLRYADRQTFETLVAKIARFAMDNGPAMRAARPQLPDALNDRAQDNWEALLAIADLAGGVWPHVARKAALKISAGESSAPSAGAELLSDIRAAFEALGAGAVPVSALARELAMDDMGPWATWNRGKPITPRQLSARIKEFGVTAKNQRIGATVAKCVQRAQFDDAFKRYLDKPDDADGG